MIDLAFKGSATLPILQRLTQLFFCQATSWGMIRFSVPDFLELFDSQRKPK